MFEHMQQRHAYV